LEIFLRFGTIKVWDYPQLLLTKFQISETFSENFLIMGYICIIKNNFKQKKPKINNNLISTVKN